MENNYLIALYDTLTQAMCNQTGEEAVKLLITSQRIQGDLETYTIVNIIIFSIENKKTLLMIYCLFFFLK